MLPTIDELGRDLLDVPAWRRFICLAAPFLVFIAYFLLALRGHWIAALACPVILSFITYGSTSHDLVHRTLRLPRWLNELLLSAIELLAVRSGHAYRVSHLHHHAHFPREDDLEAASARKSFVSAIVDGMTLQPRLWWFAMRRTSQYRTWILVEGVLVLAAIVASIALIRFTIAPAVYIALMIAGSWTFPIITVWIPHDARGDGELAQTRLFRGRVLDAIAFRHLYHLEHHLYPSVPHQHWPALARRLDPHFERAGVKAHRLFF